MASFAGPNLNTDKLILCLDAANTNSYPGSGTTWTDMSGKENDGTLTNGPTFSSDDMGSIVFDGSNDYVNATPITKPALFPLILFSKPNLESISFGEIFQYSLSKTFNNSTDVLD